MSERVICLGLGETQPSWSVLVKAGSEREILEGLGDKASMVTVERTGVVSMGALRQLLDEKRGGA